MPFDGIGFPNSDRLNQIEDVTQLIGTPNEWCKGRYKTFDGRFCIQGAIIEVKAPEIRPIILQAIHEVTGKHYRRIERFNDEIGTTHPLVLRVLARACENMIAGQTAPLTSSTATRWRIRWQQWLPSFAAKRCEAHFEEPVI